MRIRSLAATCTALAVSVGVATPARAADAPVYVQTVAPSASLQVLATSGDSIGGYTLPGIPDGMGVIKTGGTATVFLNQEISSTASSVVRAAGSSVGATVTKLTYDYAAGRITAAEDAIKRITWFDYNTGTYGAAPTAPMGALDKDAFGTRNHSTDLNRFCSSSLVRAGSLLYKAAGKTYGYNGAVYFTGEEGGDESRAFALNTATGELVQLPRFGLGAWENETMLPTGNRTTAFLMDEDATAADSQMLMYVGTKELVSPAANANTKSTKSKGAAAAAASPWYRAAGLTNGKTYALRIADYVLEKDFRAAVGKGQSTPVSFQEVPTDVNGKVQNQLSALVGTSLARIEDGAFDPNNPNDYYFITTESNKDAKATTPNPATPTVKRDGGALWRLRFNDVRNPLAGASITMLLDGAEAPYLNKPDNLVVDGKGNLLIQEDPGNNPQLSRLLAYRIADGRIGVVAQVNPAYFDKTNVATFMTEDEETSGVTDVTWLLKKSASDSASYFLFDAQVHTKPSIARPDVTDAAAKAAMDTQAVEGGQLYVLTISDWNAVYGA